MDHWRAFAKEKLLCFLDACLPERLPRPPSQALVKTIAHWEHPWISAGLTVHAYLRDVQRGGETVPLSQVIFCSDRFPATSHGATIFSYGNVVLFLTKERGERTSLLSSRSRKNCNYLHVVLMSKNSFYILEKKKNFVILVLVSC